MSPLLLSSRSSSSLWRPSFSSSWLSLSSSLLSCWLFSFSCTRSCGDSADGRGKGAQQQWQEGRAQASLRAERPPSRAVASSGVSRAKQAVLWGRGTSGMSPKGTDEHTFPAPGVQDTRPRGSVSRKDRTCSKHIQTGV